MRKRKLIRLALPAIIALLVLTGLDQRMLLRRYTVKTGMLTTPFRMAVLTDYHGCDYGANGARLVAQVADMQPDAITLVGDMFSADGDPEEELTMFRSLQSIAPCYYVTGNHEYWEYNVPNLLEQIRFTGVTVLDAESATIKAGSTSINLCGIPDPYALGDTSSHLTRAAAGTDPGAYTILLAHRPELIGQYAATNAFDLVISGHSHGGQVRIPFLINGLCAPDQGWLPRYAGGLYRVGTTAMIVSRGLSTQLQMGVPRVFNRPELLLVELQ